MRSGQFLRVFLPTLDFKFIYGVTVTCHIKHNYACLNKCKVSTFLRIRIQALILLMVYPLFFLLKVYVTAYQEKCEMSVGNLFRIASSKYS